MTKNYCFGKTGRLRYRNCTTTRNEKDDVINCEKGIEGSIETDPTCHRKCGKVKPKFSITTQLSSTHNKSYCFV